MAKPLSCPHHRRPVGSLLLALVWAGVCLAQDASLQQIETLIQQGRFLQAEAALRPLVSARPTPQGRYLLGFTLIHLFRFEEAEQQLRQAVEAEPQRHAWLHGLARSLLEQGRNRSAIEVLERAIALAPRPEYRFAKAMCALNVGELETAEAELRQALAGRPEDAEALYKLGEILVERGDYRSARRFLERALEANPGHLEARYLAGLTAAHGDDSAAAVRLFEEVLRAVPGHVGALYNLGRTLAGMGREAEARRRLEEFRAMSALQDETDFLVRAVQKNPGNLDVRLAAAGKLLRLGRAGEAMEQLAAARRLEPARPEIYDLMAEALRRSGRDEEARQAAAVARRLRERER